MQLREAITEALLRIRSAYEESAATLTLGDLPLLELPQELSTLTNLRCLSLGVEDMDHPRWWREYFGHYTTIDHYRVSDLSVLGRLSGLTRLGLGSYEYVEDLEPLSSLLNLEHLDLGSCSSITDLDSVSELVKLCALKLDWCGEISDITPISRLTSLKFLDLGACDGVRDFTSLSGLFRMRELELSNTTVTNLGFVTRMRQLRALSLINCRNVTSLAPLSRLSELRKLNLYGCSGLDDITPLMELPKLKEVNLTGSSVASDKAALAALSKLGVMNVIGVSSTPRGPDSRTSEPEHSTRLRVFLCHSSGDKQAVRELYTRLRRTRLCDPWLDERDLKAGQDWHLEINQAVTNSDIVLVCLSHNATTRAGYLHTEIKQALDVADRQPEGRIFLIPVRLEPCDVPNRLKRWQWVNLYEPAGFRQLLAALKSRHLGQEP